MKLRSLYLEPQEPSRLPQSQNPLGFAETAGWLAQDLLWIDGWFTSSSNAPLAIRMDVQGKEIQAEAQRFSHYRPDLEQAPGAFGQILLIPTPNLEGDLLSLDKVWIQLDSLWYRWSKLRLPVRPDLAARLSEKLGHFTSETRQVFTEFLGIVLEEQIEGASQHDLIFRHNSIPLRRLLPDLFEPAEEVPEEPSVVQAAQGSVGYADQEVGLGIENCWLLDRGNLLVQGWLWDVAGKTTGLALVATDGSRIPHRDAPFHFRIPKITERYRPHFADQAEGDHGFWFRVDFPASGAKPHAFELTHREDLPLLVAAPFPGNELSIIRRHLCGEVMLQGFSQAFLEQIFEPAWQTLLARSRRQLTATEFHGATLPGKAPTHSLIIPVGEDLRWIEHQLAQLAGEPTLEESELLYVLMNASHAEPFERLLQMLSRLYRVPMRGLVPCRNQSLDDALHLGAQAARGTSLVFLEGTVFAGDTDWLQRLTATCQSLENPGVVGTKLLFEDFSVANAGLVPTRDVDPWPWWSFERRFEGLPSRFPAANRREQVAALSGCLLISRQLFERLNGFSGTYLTHEMPHVDLCLQCLELGRENWYVPEVELFHLPELISADPDFFGEGVDRERIDRWQLTRRWDALLQDLHGA